MDKQYFGDTSCLIWWEVLLKVSGWLRLLKNTDFHTGKTLKCNNQSANLFCEYLFKKQNDGEFENIRWSSQSLRPLTFLHEHLRIWWNETIKIVFSAINSFVCCWPMEPVEGQYKALGFGLTPYEFYWPSMIP